MDALLRDLAVPIGILADERFAEANSALVKFCGRDLVTACWRDIFADRDHVTIASAIAAAMSGQTRRHAVHCMRGTSTCAVEVSLSPATHDGASAVAIALEDVSLREVLAERLIESENRLQRLVSSVGDAIVAVDTRGRIVLWNEAATRIFGYTEIETLGETFAMLFPPDLADQYATQHFTTGALASLGKTTFSRARRKDGATFPTQMSFASSDFGGAVWFTAVIHDDSERQQLIDSLGRSEASLRALVEQSPDPLFVHGPGATDYEIIFANESMHTLLGYGPGELVGRRSVETFVHPDDREKLASNRGGELHAPLELRWKRTDGSVLDIQSMSRVVRFDDRPAVLVFARDITDRLRQERERARAEAVLRQSEERHRIMFDANPLASWMLDPTTLRFTAVNDAMVRTYGYSREELLQLTMLDLRVDDDRETLRLAVSAPTIGHVKNVGVKRQRRKDGSSIDVDITVHPIPLAGGTIVLGIGKDVTNELRLEEQLRQTQKMEAVGQLAGGIAHDFNNILAVITANTDLALDTLGRAHPVAEDLAEIDAAAARAAGLTRQLLAFSRKERREVKQLALNGIVTSVEKMLSRIVGEDIVISAVLASQLGTIAGDAGQIEQILMNLLVNARDAMPRGGKVLIETANVEIDEVNGAALGIGAGRYVSLSVTDNGCGMDDTVRAHIFEPFFTTKDVGKGTGLGLATVFGIVKQGGGAIAVESQVGRGTTFRIYFPRLHTEAEPVRVQPQFIAPRGAGTVLLVEDDAQLRLVLRRHLAKWGYNLLEAPSGTAALELAMSYDGAIDLLLTDLVMPELDGRSLSRRLLELRPSTKVVFMSGYTEHPALHDAELGPADFFMQKPFSAQVLSETLRRALD